MISAANWLRVMVRTIWYVAHVLCLVKLVAWEALALAVAAAGGLRGYSGDAAAGMMNEDEILN